MAVLSLQTFKKERAKLTLLSFFWGGGASLIAMLDSCNDVVWRKGLLSKTNFGITLSCQSGRMVASIFVRMPPGQVVRVRAVARDIVLCFWATHLTRTVPLSTQGRVVQSLIKLTQG